MAVTMKCCAELLNCFPGFYSFLLLNILALRCVRFCLNWNQTNKQPTSRHVKPPSKELKVEWNILQGEKMRALAQAWV